MKREELKYNDVVVVEKGLHKGKIGVFDDDTDNGCISCFLSRGDSPSEYAEIRPSSVRLATEAEEAAWQKTRDIIDATLTAVLRGSAEATLH